MANILTVSEAAAVLRCEEDDAVMLAILAGVDAYLAQATGVDWTQDDPIREEAKNAARMLLVMWHENPAMIGSETPLSFGLNGCLLQLKAIAGQTKHFYGSNGKGMIPLSGVYRGEIVQSLIAIRGASGDWSTGFETVISMDGFIQQTGDSDYSGILFRARIIPPSELSPSSGVTV